MVMEITEKQLDKLTKKATFIGLDVFDDVLLNTIIEYISQNKLTPEEAKKIGEIRIIAYEQARKKIKEAGG